MIRSHSRECLVACLALLLGHPVMSGSPQPETGVRSAESKAPSACPEPSDPYTRARIIRLPHSGLRNSVAFSPDGKTLASGGQDNQVRMWDVATGKQRYVIASHQAPGGVSRLCFFPDGKTLVSGSWAGDGTVKLWEVATGGLRRVVGRDPGGICFVAVSPGGRFLIWGNWGLIHRHDVAMGKEGWPMLAPTVGDSVVFSPDGRLLASVNGSFTVRLSEVATGRAIRDFPADPTVETGSQGVAFSPDGKTLATASMGGKSRWIDTIIMWNVATGKEIRQFGRPDDVYRCIAFSPDGRTIASGSESLRLWEVKTGKELCDWDGPASSVVFSPDGKWLAFGSLNSVVLVHFDGPSVAAKAKAQPQVFRAKSP